MAKLGLRPELGRTRAGAFEAGPTNFLPTKAPPKWRILNKLEGGTPSLRTMSVLRGGDRNRAFLRSILCRLEPDLRLTFSNWLGVRSSVRFLV